MDQGGVLVEGYGRIRGIVARVTDGMDAEALAWRPGPDANSVAWLCWHLARVHDSHLAPLMGTDEVWETGGWVDRFGLALDRADTGYGHRPDQVAAVRVDDPALLVGYLDAVHAATLAWVAQRSAEDLEQVVDTSYDPPVTLGVRLVSVLSDGLQHAGQAAYVRGLARS